MRVIFFSSGGVLLAGKKEARIYFTPFSIKPFEILYLYRIINHNIVGINLLQDDNLSPLLSDRDRMLITPFILSDNRSIPRCPCSWYRTLSTIRDSYKAETNSGKKIVREGLISDGETRSRITSKRSTTLTRTRKR